MKKCLIILILFSFLGLTLFAQNTQKRNVLFIATDDLNTAIGCYGNSFVKTPNIDRLAKRGVNFTNAHCQVPWCSPSRSSILTGLRPDSVKIMDLQTHFRTTVPDVVTLPQYFKNNGYHSARIGKIYHYSNPMAIGTDGLDDSISWHERVNPVGQGKLEEDKIINLTPKKNFGNAMAYWASTGTDEEQTDGKVATEAIRIMNERKKEPFFLAVGFFSPHAPFVAPKKYFDLYDTNKIVLPYTNPADTAKFPKFAFNPTHPSYFWQDRPDLKKTIIQAYYASISFVDAQVGRLLDELDRLGLAENTVIVFWSDHGYQLSEHGQWMKQSLWEEATHTPLILVDPKLPPQYKGCSRTVELLDIYPTLTDLCNLPKPNHLMGTSLKPLMLNPTQNWDRPAYTQVLRTQGNVMGRTVRTETWRYTEWGDGKKGVELYDLTKDPKEQNNLGSAEGYENTRKEMKQLLAKIRKAN
jgi:iduronate 2-sulfatase